MINASLLTVSVVEDYVAKWSVLGKAFEKVSYNYALLISEVGFKIGFRIF